MEKQRKERIMYHETKINVWVFMPVAYGFLGLFWGLDAKIAPLFCRIATHLNE
jgi:hypothetical protein